MMMGMGLAAVIVVMMMIVILMAVLMVVMMLLVLMMVMEHLLGLFLSMHLHGHMGSADAALAHGFPGKFHTRNSQAVQFCHNRIRVRHKLQ